MLFNSLASYYFSRWSTALYLLLNAQEMALKRKLRREDKYITRKC